MSSAEAHRSNWKIFTCEQLFEAPPGALSPVSDHHSTREIANLSFPGKIPPEDSAEKPIASAALRVFFSVCKELFENKAHSVKSDAAGLLTRMAALVKNTQAATGIHARFILRWLSVRHEILLQMIQTSPIESLLASLLLDLLRFYEEVFPASIALQEAASSLLFNPQSELSSTVRKGTTYHVQPDPRLELDTSEPVLTAPTVQRPKSTAVPWYLKEQQKREFAKWT